MNIKELRKAKGLTQIELAQEVGISLSTIKRWESKQTFPRINDRNKLENILKIEKEENEND